MIDIIDGFFQENDEGKIDYYATLVNGEHVVLHNVYYTNITYSGLDYVSDGLVFIENTKKWEP